MDYHIQILCRFQKTEQKVPRPSPLSTKNHPLPLKGRFFSSFEGVKGDFLVLRGDSRGTFPLVFWNLIKFGYNNS